MLWFELRFQRAGLKQKIEDLVFHASPELENKYPQLLPSVMKPHTQLYQCTAILTFNILSISVHDWMQSQVRHTPFKAGHWPVLGPFTTFGKSVCVAILRMPLGSAKGHLKSNLIEQFPILFSQSYCTTFIIPALEYL